MRATLGALGGGAAVVVAAAAAWACVSGPAVTLSSTTAKPGQELTLSGTGFSKPDPVTVRWNALDGPVVGTAGPARGPGHLGNRHGARRRQSGQLPPGSARASADGKLSQMPVRALVTVSPDGASPVAGAPLGASGAPRASGLASRDESISAGALVLVALGVAGLALFAVGVATLAISRRAAAPEPARVRR